jgi:hypothetical protein
MIEKKGQMFFFRGCRVLAPFANEFFRDGKITGFPIRSRREPPMRERSSEDDINLDADMLVRKPGRNNPTIAPPARSYRGASNRYAEGQCDDGVATLVMRGYQAVLGWWHRDPPVVAVRGKTCIGGLA